MTQNTFPDNSQVINLPSPDKSNSSGDTDLTPKRMTISFSAELNQHLVWLAQQQGISQAEAVRKAVALESYLRQALQKPGAKLLIEDESSVREIIIR
ncbi:CopG family transcriptional regulator [Pleurocapsa sp. PCC 7319]|uniref:ribbon-helix-helix domain-containing protein n=1 Tax=Pleurocapsa sp. PCC 7319 TaxID=118161 RepID=UPI000346B23A|nr:CopG family transcriptional regulator [Pleurocapsa sp. PCC 7319]